MRRELTQATTERDDYPTTADIINDGETGCRFCGDTFFRVVRSDGTVEACEGCGDGEYNLTDEAEETRQILRDAVTKFKERK